MFLDVHGLSSIFMDLSGGALVHIQLNIVIQCGNKAASQNALKLGPGRMSHFEIAAYAIKDTVPRKRIKVEESKLAIDDSSDMVSWEPQTVDNTRGLVFE
jgi:hypothetical protein